MDSVWTWVVVSICVVSHTIPRWTSVFLWYFTMNEGIPFGDDHTTSMAQMVDEIIRYQTNMDSLGRFGRPGFHDEKCSLLCVKRKIDNANIDSDRLRESSLTSNGLILSRVCWAFHLCIVLMPFTLYSLRFTNETDYGYPPGEGKPYYHDFGFNSARSLGITIWLTSFAAQ